MAEPNKIVVDSISKPNPVDVPQALKISLHTHKTIDSINVVTKEHLNTKDWQVGDKVEFIVVGVEHDGGRIEGIRIH